MSPSQTKEILHSTSYAVVAAIGFSVALVTGSVASPEDEIARLNRVRTNLFEELVKARAEAATARTDLEAAIKGRDAAEAEVVRLKQEAASAKSANPAPHVQTNVEPQKRVMNTPSSTPRRQGVRPIPPAATGSVRRTATTDVQQRVVRAGPAPRVTIRQSEPASRQAAPVARAQELPSVLRLQDPQ